MREILTLITQREDLKTHWKTKSTKVKNKYVEQNFLLKEKRMYILNAGIYRNIISRRRHFFFKNLLQKESAAIMSLSFLALVLVFMKVTYLNLTLKGLLILKPLPFTVRRVVRYVVNNIC